MGNGGGGVIEFRVSFGERERDIVAKAKEEELKKKKNDTDQ